MISKNFLTTRPLIRDETTQAKCSISSLFPPSSSISNAMGMLQSHISDKDDRMSKGHSTHWHRHSYPSQASPAVLANPPPSNQTTPSTVKPLPQVPREIRAAKNGQTYEYPGRNIVICLDGTGDQFDDDNSSIVHFVSCLKKSDPSQVTYYQSGIGTYNGGGLSNGLNAAMDMAVGSGLGVHIRDAYRFLMHNYKQNDKICLFGFSRGAYTARCLAGMLHKVGLLPAHNISQIEFAYQYYKDDSTKGWEMSEDFKRTFCMNVNVYFVGVFDSVASVGFIPRKLPLSSTPKNRSSYFRHALALDERRAKFKPCRYRARDNIDKTSSWKVAAEEETVEHHDRKYDNDVIGTSSPNPPKLDLLPENEEFTDASAYQAPPPLLRAETALPVADTDVLEVWFAGCHCDVGGGAVKNEERHKLSQIPLRWMIRQCFDCDTGIIFKAHRLAEEGLDIHTLYPEYIPLKKPTIGPPPSLKNRKERGGLGSIHRRSSVLEKVREKRALASAEKTAQELYEMKIYADANHSALHEDWIPEQYEDYFDSLEPIHDMLTISKPWWILEYWPIKVRVLKPHDHGKGDEEEEWVKKVSVNHGRYRPVQEKKPNLHWTVQQRMFSTDYQIRARGMKGMEWNLVV